MIVGGGNWWVGTIFNMNVILIFTSPRGCFLSLTFIATIILGFVGFYMPFYPVLHRTSHRIYDSFFVN